MTLSKYIDLAKPQSRGRFHSNGTDIFRNFIPKFLGVPREVGLKFRKIGITGKFRSIRPFLFGASFSSLEIEFNMADPQACKYDISPLSDKRLKYLTSTLLQWISLDKF